MNTGILYIVATPIGNLSDITYRAVEILKKSDLIICEDTRVSKKLLERYEISTPTISFYQNNKKGGAKKPFPKLNLIINELRSGKNMAFITDAGTPGISDPGNRLVGEAIKNQIIVIPIPGVSSITTLSSVSGVDLSEFSFFGFPPHKKGRETFFNKLVNSDFPVIYFESPHRLIKNLELLRSLDSQRNMILGRELTKMFEEIVRGSIGEVFEYFQKNRDKIRGEFIIILE